MKNNSTEQRNRGSVALLVAFGVIALLGCAALAIDIGYALATRAQLQNVADAGSMAGNRTLVKLYQSKGNIDIGAYVLTSTDKAAIIAKVNEYTLQNKAGGVPISVAPSDIAFGVWNIKTGSFTPGDKGVNTVSVTARRDATSNGAVSTMLAGVLGVHSFAIKADAGASGVSGLKRLPPGKGDIPVGISRYWFTSRQSPCAGADSTIGTDARIRFYPTGDLAGCAGWHVFTDTPSSAAKLSGILKGLQENKYTSPNTLADSTTYNFTGGTVASAFPDMKHLYDAKKGADGKWLVHIPVYDRDDCQNPNANYKIVGFATARIYSVTTSPNNEIWARVECQIVPWGDGGGTYYGTAIGSGSVTE